MTDHQRIGSLDGLRGLAIAMVVLFHAYAGHQALIPWAYNAGLQPVARFGWLGVELFFLISGFVILMSLEKCPTFLEFLRRRWLRLFPGMLIATVLVFCTAILMPERPLGQPRLFDSVWGLFFVDPEIFKAVGVEARALEGVFWSLFVEVKFYLIFGALYFIFPRRAVAGLTVLFGAAFVYKLAAFFGAVPRSFDTLIFTVLSLQYFGWFCVGAILYRFHVTRKPWTLLLATLVLAPAVLATAGSDKAVMAISVAIYLVFCVAIFTRIGVACFASPLPVMAGFVSYPLYLIHENAMVALTIKAHSIGLLAPVLTPLLGLFVIVGVSYVIAAHLEPLLRQLLSALLHKSQ